MKKLGIIGAMQVEVEILLSRMEEKKECRIAGMDFFEGKLEDLDVVVVQCGVGKVNAAMCTQALCSCFGVTHLVNTGIAGSLSADLDIGDLLVSVDAMYHDFDCVHFGYPFGQVPGLDVIAYTADAAMVDYAWAAAQEVHPGHVKKGRVASGDQFVAEKPMKERIIANTGGLCTEMEGAAIAQVAYRNQIPFVILRAISDKADDNVELDYPSFERLAAHRGAEVACKLARQLREN